MGTWIEISPFQSHEEELHRRSLRGNVDRNTTIKFRLDTEPEVVPYVGTWIEITKLYCHKPRYRVVPYVGTWIEMKVLQESDERYKSRSLRGNVDRNNGCGL